MTKDQAKELLAASLQNLYEKRGQITMQDVEAEVINNACLHVLVNEHEEHAAIYGQAFAEAASELIPQYSEQHVMNAIIGVQQNVAWDGMLDFLRSYFLKNHGVDIYGGNENVSIKVFNSNLHKRYVNNQYMEESEVERIVNIEFSNDDREALISISPSLSPKKAALYHSKENTHTYHGTDPDYVFYISYDEFDEIEKFVLEMPNRGLRIDYFE